MHRMTAMIVDAGLSTGQVAQRLVVAGDAACLSGHGRQVYMTAVIDGDGQFAWGFADVHLQTTYDSFPCTATNCWTSVGD
jgi:hypothetical protein